MKGRLNGVAWVDNSWRCSRGKLRKYDSRLLIMVRWWMEVVARIW